MIDGAILNLKPVMSKISFPLDRFSLFRMRSSLSEAYFVPLSNSFQTDVFGSGEVDPSIRPVFQNPACELTVNDNITLVRFSYSSLVNELINGRIFQSLLS